MTVGKRVDARAGEWQGEEFVDCDIEGGDVNRVVFSNCLFRACRIDVERSAFDDGCVFLED